MIKDLRNWELLAERKIREAFAEGVFQNLPGSGRPISLEEDPFEPADLRMAHRLLKNNGFAPAWIEESKDLDAAIGILRQNLARAWRLRKKPVEAHRGYMRETFRQAFEETNQRILSFNLK